MLITFLIIKYYIVSIISILVNYFFHLVYEEMIALAMF